MFAAWQVRRSGDKKYGYFNQKITQIQIMKDSHLVITPFYWRYVEPIHEVPLFEAMDQAENRLLEILSSLSDEKGGYRYQPEKWSIKEVLNHILDAERIMAYRALRFARNDKTPLPSFEENDYAPESNADSRTLADLTDEFKSLRKSTENLFRSFTGEMMTRTGTVNGAELSVLALGYIIAGHCLHHCRILAERYHAGAQ